MAPWPDDKFMETLRHRHRSDAIQIRSSDLWRSGTKFGDLSTQRTPSPRHPHQTATPLTHEGKKRIFDLAIALPAVVLTLPLIVVLAVGSAISFRAWPFFTQTRLGHHGKEFRFVKIRSLPASAPAPADKYELQAVQNTRFGRFLRTWHLDELPQLWLVVWGTMSLVGPRPEMPSLAATFDPDFVAERMTVKPGCTGLWQISDASGGLIGENPSYDRLYVAESSRSASTCGSWCGRRSRCSVQQPSPRSTMSLSGPRPKKRRQRCSTPPDESWETASRARRLQTTRLLMAIGRMGPGGFTSGDWRGVRP